MKNEFACVAFLACGVPAVGQTIERIDVSSAGIESNGPINSGDGQDGSISADGRFVAFASIATNLVDGDTNSTSDVFLRDRAAGTTIRISVTPDGAEGNGPSTLPRISADARWIVFESIATNLGGPGLFVHDRAAGRTSAAGPNGASVPFATVRGLSADGRYAMVEANHDRLPGAAGSMNVFVLDRETGLYAIASVSPDGRISSADDYATSISADGRFVAFHTLSYDLLPGSPVNSYSDAFVHDRDPDGNGTFDEGFGALEAASITASGDWGIGDSTNPRLSADGRFVAFCSGARNLVPNDRARGGFEILLRDRLTGIIEVCDIDSNGLPGGGGACLPLVRLDGRLVFFQSFERLAPNETDDVNDVFVRDRLTQVTQRVNVTVSGDPANGVSTLVDVSLDGSSVLFWSEATNLVPGDTNRHGDLFVRDLESFAPIEVEPSIGSRLGGDVVHVIGARPTNIGNTHVTFGGAPAEVLAVDDDRVSVRTPPGRGWVDVVVSSPAGSATLARAYHFVAPELAARAGTVNTGRGERENVLLANATAGAPGTREVSLGTQEPLRLVVVAPSSRASAAFVVYAWRRLPDAMTRVALPSGFGSMVFPVPFTGGSPQPIAVWNNLGRRRTLGTPTAPSQPAPSTLVNFPNGASRRARVTLQGLIQDDASPTGVGLSITNAILLRVQ
ncbi:MAG: PD40 domain-containing protein [Planctomycetes bacterium]|nr:PD40 domain-containing protein [Planctomycetota bacterium]MBI3847263.1 PD40 domain-containing protein [Planctomycetota bacterium]